MDKFEITKEEVITMYAMAVGDNAKESENDTSYVVRVWAEKVLGLKDSICDVNTLISESNN